MPTHLNINACVNGCYARKHHTLQFEQFLHTRHVIWLDCHTGGGSQNYSTEPKMCPIYFITKENGGRLADDSWQKIVHPVQGQTGSNNEAM